MEATAEPSIPARNIFVLGVTRSAKTSVGNRLARDVAGYLLSASDWIKARLSGSEPQDQKTAVQLMTSASERFLKADPQVAARYMAVRTAPGFINIYEGIRNPNDFVRLYDPRVDLVILLSRYEHPSCTNPLGPATDFEELGLEAINAILAFNTQVDPSVADRTCEFSWWKTGDDTLSLEAVYQTEILEWVLSHVHRTH